MSTAEAVPTIDAGHFGEFPYYFDVIQLKHLFVDEEYQRPLTSFVKTIETKFDPLLLGVLILSKRSNTKYAIVDGQTRAEGARRNGVKALPAIIFEGLSPEQEASIFHRLQTERRGMAGAARFKARLKSGEEQAKAVSEVVSDCGYAIDVNVATTGNTIAATAALEWVFLGARENAKKKTPDPALLSDVLITIKEAWPTLPETARTAVMIKGMGFYLANNENVDLERLAQRLSKVTPSELAQRAASLRVGRGMSGQSPSYMAEAIAAQYKRARG